ncbi:MAG: SapC family protein [Ruegeria sp.]
MVSNGLFPISFERHSNCSWHRFTTYHFARHVTECDVVSAEIVDVAATFPIAFRKLGNAIKPVAVFALSNGHQNPFVSKNGHWRASYVPSFLRCHPFLAEPIEDADDPRSQKLSLLVNESTGFVSVSQSGAPFFTEDRQISAELLQVQRFLQIYLAQQKAAIFACKLMSELELFTPPDELSEIGLPGGTLGIDFNRLKHLPAAQSAILLTSGALQMIFAHQVSLSHVGWLQRLQDSCQPVDTSLEQQPMSDLNGFLNAVTSDQSSTDLEIAHAIL